MVRESSCSLPQPSRSLRLKIILLPSLGVTSREIKKKIDSCVHRESNRDSVTPALTNEFQKLESHVPKPAEAKRDGVINPKNNNFNRAKSEKFKRKSTGIRIYARRLLMSALDSLAIRLRCLNLLKLLWYYRIWFYEWIHVWQNMYQIHCGKWCIATACLTKSAFLIPMYTHAFSITAFRTLH